MVAVPANMVTQEDLTTWSKMKEELNALKAAEMLLRVKIFKGMFPHPTEGTNTTPLQAGWVLKAGYPISRKPDTALLTSMAPMFREKGIPVDVLIRTVPELAIAEYRKLTKEQMHLFDQVLEIKPGSPSLEIMQPKRVAAA